MVFDRLQSSNYFEHDLFDSFGPEKNHFNLKLAIFGLLVETKADKKSRTWALFHSIVRSTFPSRSLIRFSIQFFSIFLFIYSVIIYKVIHELALYIYFSSEKKKRERIRNINILTFFPSNSWVPCANTLSTLDGSPNVINPKPLQVNKAKNKRKNWLVGMFDWFMFPWCCFWRMHFKVSKKKE